MTTQERRKHRRTKLRLRISRMDGLPVPEGTSDLWTSDLSSGGMYVLARLVDPPAVGTNIAFELRIPPGEGYSLSAGWAKGSGKVARVDTSPGPVTGIGVGFTSPLALEF